MKQAFDKLEATIKDEVRMIKWHLKEGKVACDAEDTEEEQPREPQGAMKTDVTSEQELKVRTWLDENQDKAEMARVYDRSLLDMDEDMTTSQ
eukprot:10339403-Heterocapsa_arctica.AAC.1